MFEKLFQKLFGESLVKKYVGSAVRTVMAVLAGYIAAGGMPEVAEQLQQLSPQITDIVVAVVLYFIAQGWSLKQKKDQKPEQQEKKDG